MKDAQLDIYLENGSPILGTMCFLWCKFESFSPIRKEIASKEETTRALEEFHQTLGGIAEKDLQAMSMNEHQRRAYIRHQHVINESIDQLIDIHNLSLAQTERLTEFQKLKIDSNATNACLAISVGRGTCAMLNCEISNCIGAGILVLNDFELPQAQELLLYMKGCTIRHCDFAGAEARQHGNMFLEDCDISNNCKGIMVHDNASNVLFSRSNIFNNNLEGIIGGENLMLGSSYDSTTRLMIDKCSIHHNQLGVSLAYLRSIAVQNSQVFSNRSWGIFLQSSNLTLIHSNDLFFK